MKKIFCLLLVLLCFGCMDGDKNKVYDVKEASDETYLINRKTGEISLIDEGRVLKLPEYSLLEDPEVFKVSGSFQEKLQFKAQTKQIGNRVYYILELEAYKPRYLSYKEESLGEKLDFQWLKSALLEDYTRNYIILQFFDLHGFNIGELNINLASNYTNVVGEDGKPVKFKYEGHSLSLDPFLLSKATSLHYVYRLDVLEKIESKDG